MNAADKIAEAIQRFTNADISLSELESTLSDLGQTLRPDQITKLMEAAYANCLAERTSALTEDEKRIAANRAIKSDQPKPWEPGFDIKAWELSKLNICGQLETFAVTELHAAMMGRIRELEEYIGVLYRTIKGTDSQGHGERRNNWDDLFEYGSQFYGKKGTEKGRAIKTAVEEIVKNEQG